METSRRERVRAYTVWASKNTFCCRGHCMLGPSEDCSAYVCAWCSTLVPMALFFLTWGDALWQFSNAFVGIMLASFAATILCFLATTFTDPGVNTSRLFPRAAFPTESVSHSAVPTSRTYQPSLPAVPTSRTSQLFLDHRSLLCVFPRTLYHRHPPQRHQAYECATAPSRALGEWRERDGHVV